MTKGKKKKELTIEEKLEQALVPREEWPYEVPENWCWVRLKDVCTFENGYAFKSDFFVEDGIPVIRISNIHDNLIDIEGCVCTSQTDIEERYIVNKGDLLIAMSGATTGKNGVYYSDKRAYLNQRVGNIKIKNNILIPQYRNYYIMSIQRQILDSSYGGAQPNISSNIIGKIFFPLPPLPEQQRIVDRIESLFSKLDEAKEKAQEALDSCEERKAAILHKAFSGELTEKWREENGVSIDSWRLTTLSEIVNEFRYGLSEKSDYKNNGIPVLRIPNIDEGFLDFSDLKYLKSSTVDKESLLQQNDILIIRSNGSRDLVGKCALVPKLDKEFTYASFLIRIKTSEKIDADFLVKYLNSVDARSQMFAKAKSSSGIHNINSRELGIIKINVPTNKEQKEIVKIINYLLDKEESQKRVIEIVLSQIDTVKKSILAKAFRGELGTNYLEEEGAIEMLINGGKYK